MWNEKVLFSIYFYFSDARSLKLYLTAVLLIRSDSLEGSRNYQMIWVNQGIVLRANIIPIIIILKIFNIPDFNRFNYTQIFSLEVAVGLL